MTTVLCTLYNSLYLDKGLVLYDSLCECAKDFKLYVLCMDDKCYEVLTDLHQEHHIPVKLSDFEDGDEELLKAKSNRPIGEYCWTCSSSFIRYVLLKFNEPICTYIDADMFFFNDPQVLVDEMVEAGKSVMVTPHRFPEEKKALAKKVGKYCVEFNTFKNNKDGLEVLEFWRDKCLECCSNIGDGTHWGDQKYLEELEGQFECVHICDNPGAGIAPWNISLYQSLDDKCSSVCYKRGKICVDIVFFHYQGITYKNSNEVSTAVEANRPDIDYKLVDSLYYHYLRRIDNKKKILKSEYDTELLIKTHPSNNHMTGLRAIFHKTWAYRLLLRLFVIVNGNKPYMVDLSNI